MTVQALPERVVIVASFLKRLEGLEGIVRVCMSRARLSILFMLRDGQEKRVLMDFSRSPARVAVDGDAKTGHVLVAIRARILHDIFLERMKPGVALGRREMLLRGKAMDLARVIPLFEVAPVLYREHLADAGFPGYGRKDGKVLSGEELMNEEVFKGDPIPLVRLSGLEKAGVRIVNGLAYGIGYLVGVLRYRLFKKLSLFGVLTAMSRGLEAATPREIKEAPEPEG